MVLGFGIIALVALIAIALEYKATNPISAPEAELPEIATTTPTTKTTTKPTTKTTTGTLTYEQAVAKYDDVRMQFNTACQPTPSRQTYKNNTTVMFDNRSAGKRTITVDGKAYTIAAEGYILVKLSSTKLPHVVTINCGTQNNVAQITLQQ